MIVSTGTIMNSTWGYYITSSVLTTSPANTQTWSGTTAWSSWFTPTLAPNGHMYMAPGTATCVIKVISGSVNSSTSNYSTSTIQFISASSDGGTLFLPGGTGANGVNEKFPQLLLAPNGKMYSTDWSFRPTTANNNIGYIIEVDPSTDTYRTQSFTYPGVGSNRTLSPVLGIDGYYYWMMQSANTNNSTFRIYRFNTNLGLPTTVQSSSLLNTLIPGINASPNYALGSLASNGRIYFIPRTPITSSNFNTTRNVAICVNTDLFASGTTNGITSIPLPPEIVATGSIADIEYWGSKIGLDGCTYWPPRFLSFGSVSTSNTKTLKLDPNGGPAGTGSFTLVGPAMTNNTSNNNISFDYITTLNGDLFGFPLSSWNRTFSIVPSGSSPTVISSSVYPINNLTFRGSSIRMFPSGKTIINSSNFTSTANLRFTSSFYEFFSVKGNYPEVTNINIIDTDLFTPPTPISNLPTSRYNWYFNK